MRRGNKGRRRRKSRANMSSRGVICSFIYASSCLCCRQGVGLHLPQQTTCGSYFRTVFIHSGYVMTTAQHYHSDHNCISLQRCYLLELKMGQNIFYESENFRDAIAPVNDLKSHSSHFSCRLKFSSTCM